MEGIPTRSVLLIASLVTLATATLLVSLPSGEAPEPVRKVSAVAVADGGEALEAPRELQDARTMVASYYASSLEGNPTANGGVYRPGRYTAAHRTLPMGTELRISYGNESVRVTINDRGPYVPGHDLDLSFAAAEDIGLVEPGVAPVRVTVL